MIFARGCPTVRGHRLALPAHGPIPRCQAQSTWVLLPPLWHTPARTAPHPYPLYTRCCSDAQGRGEGNTVQTGAQTAPTVLGSPAERFGHGTEHSLASSFLHHNRIPARVLPSPSACRPLRATARARHPGTDTTDTHNPTPSVTMHTIPSSALDLSVIRRGPGRVRAPVVPEGMVSPFDDVSSWGCSRVRFGRPPSAAPGQRWD